MANYAIGAIGASNQAHGISTATNFLDQEGSAYFVELEEALMQGVVGFRTESIHGEKKPFFPNRPPTLEIFPSWPMRFQQGNSQREESSGSGSSAQNTSSHQDSGSPVSKKDSLGMHQLDKFASNQRLGTQEKKGMAATSILGKNGKILDAKTQRRLAQNREAARKSRLRKKAYIQQLESGRIKLSQLEQEIQRLRPHGLLLPGMGNQNGTLSSGAAMFDMEYGRWLEENYKRMTELRGALQAHVSDIDLRVAVDDCLANYDEAFRLKAAAVKNDVFHVLNGMWKSPAERCFLWLGGFRPSDLIKMVTTALEPLTDDQVMGVCGLQQSSQQAEEALSQGLEQLQLSLAETMATGPHLMGPNDGGNVGQFMGQMAVALGRLANLEGLVRQADTLRQHTMHQLRQVLTVRQAARCFLAIGEYHSRLRALSSLWASRPRQHRDLAIEESPCAVSSDLQMLQQSVHSHFSAF
ncbi:hypothetical protein HPP92_003230 [Vanilla planifolia]|uniref:Uncharacterized protein n=1 Tax=Vanilla planifolia TaxID=51239 RepID=A0A835RZL0_VANPL|nr:hypothetical protein HPP92_003230 [Vanilla planifolia]